MTPGTVRIERAPDGVWVIAPDDAPSVLDDAAGIHVAVLEVLGGHLSWSVLAEHAVPAAVIDDVDSAQNWLWAVFGEEVALAVAAGSGTEISVAPARPRVADGARRLAYAHWAARWWPTSTIDALPPLDDRCPPRTSRTATSMPAASARTLGASSGVMIQIPSGARSIRTVPVVNSPSILEHPPHP